MAAQIVCFFNKHGFCKYLEKCQNFHENRNCEKTTVKLETAPLDVLKPANFSVIMDNHVDKSLGSNRDRDR